MSASSSAITTRRVGALDVLLSWVTGTGYRGAPVTYARPSRVGGIGRRGALKRRCPKGRVGSSPTPGTHAWRTSAPTPRHNGRVLLGPDDPLPSLPRRIL